jgi:hypothetical protein
MDGRFKTDAALAKALTERVRARGEDKEVSEQNVSGIRTRHLRTSVYLLDIARLCNVSPYWLAFEEGPMRPAAPLRVADQGFNELIENWPTLELRVRNAILAAAKALRGDEPRGKSTPFRKRPAE